MELSKDYVQKRFIKHIRMLVDYWEKEAPQERTTRERLEGLVFSILSAIDGSSVSLPKFILAPDPHPDDKKYHVKEGTDYFPDNNRTNVKCDISGDLHDKFYKQ